MTNTTRISAPSVIRAGSSFVVTFNANLPANTSIYFSFFGGAIFPKLTSGYSLADQFVPTTIAPRTYTATIDGGYNGGQSQMVTVFNDTTKQWGVQIEVNIIP